jgi:hypothetical protein
LSPRSKPERAELTANDCLGMIYRKQMAVLGSSGNSILCLSVSHITSCRSTT